VILLAAAAALALAAVALFSAFEAALASLSRIRLRYWVGKRLSGAPREELLERPERLITTTFVGANLARVALGAAASALLLAAARWPAEHPVGGALAVVALLIVPAVVVGEVLPRAAVAENPARLLPLLVGSGRLLAVLFRPYTLLVEGAAALVFRALRLPRGGDRAFTRDSVEALLREGEREGVVEAHEREIIGGVLSLGDTTVGEVMTPREQVVTVSLGERRETLARRIWETGFSRFPVVDGSPENVVGIVHAVDVLIARDAERLRLRPTLFVPASTPGHELLYAMRRQRTQLAVVLDDAGAFAGIVTMEDLVEELVGEIRDEHDVDEGAAGG
jgi:putative hemolysin